MPGAKLVIERDGLQGVISGLAGRGYRVIGPTARDGAIVYDNTALLDERPQQMGLAIEQSEERFRAHRPRDQIGHAPLGIGDAARPATPVAGASLRKPSARIPLGSHGGIWTKRLRFLDLGS